MTDDEMALGNGQDPLPPLLDPLDYLRRHLHNDLSWMLRAVEQWKAEERLQRAVVGFEVQVFAMDSAFLHARALFEFLTRHTGPFNYSVDQYGVIPLKSRRYRDWSGPLHRHVMHAQGRDSPRQLKTGEGRLDLNQTPPAFAVEIERLWTDFAAKLVERGDRQMATEVLAVLSRAKDAAAMVARSELNQ